MKGNTIKVKELTNLQRYASQMVSDGWRMKTINQHWASGGTQIWVKGEQTRNPANCKALIGFLRKEFGYFYDQNPNFIYENYFIN